MSKQILIALIETGRGELERAASAVPDDKVDWKPLDNGRTVRDLLGDAAQAPALAVGMIRGTLQFGPQLIQQQQAERANWTRDEAMQHLATNTQELIAAIEEFPEEKLNEPLTLPMGGGMTLPWGAWMMMAYRSFLARTGQINYIQTLYGDFDRH